MPGSFDLFFFFRPAWSPQTRDLLKIHAARPRRACADESPGPSATRSNDALVRNAHCVRENRPRAAACGSFFKAAKATTLGRRGLDLSELGGTRVAECMAAFRVRGIGPRS